jgi:hypothetical protein
LLYAEELTDIQTRVAVCWRTDRETDMSCCMLKNG